MYCPNCGGNNPEGLLNCNSCNYKLPGGAEPLKGRDLALSKGFFLGSIGIGLGISYLLDFIVLIYYYMALGGVTSSQVYGFLETAGTLQTISVIPLLFGGIVLLVFIYKIWAAIQDGHARTTPGKAVGFLFIPIYSFYWIFPAIWGFARDFNHLISRRKLNINFLPENLFLAVPIMTLLTFIGQLIMFELALFLGIVNFVLVLMVVSAACDGVNSLATQSTVVKKEERQASPVITEYKEPPPAPAEPVTSMKQAIPVLKGLKGHYSGRMVELSANALVIGRDANVAQLIYPSKREEISRKHCSVYFDERESKFVIEDYSSNGTFLSSNQRLPAGVPKYLEPGDSFYLVNPVELFQVSFLEK